MNFRKAPTNWMSFLFNIIEKTHTPAFLRNVVGLFTNKTLPFVGSHVFFFFFLIFFLKKKKKKKKKKKIQIFWSSFFANPRGTPPGVVINTIGVIVSILSYVSPLVCMNNRLQFAVL
jgi:hypothetical protein